jgi:hypothetical protein
MGGFLGFELKQLDPEKRDLFHLGEAGYTVFRPEDLDWTFKPWLTDGDGAVWIYDAGVPAAGRKPTTHAVFVNDDGSWNYLTAAAASGRKDAPKDRAELERRAREAEEHAKRQAAQRERELAALRKSAVPVTSGDVDGALKWTLAELRALRHRRDVLDDAIALERGFVWRRTAARLAAVGITVRL